MGKARWVPRLISLLIAVTFLAISSSASAQNAASTCSTPATEISNVSRPTGVLRADPNANDTASKKIASDAMVACSNLSDPGALRQVRMKISDNNIILSGTVPTATDEQQLIAIVSNNADGRAVFNRLEVVPVQTAKN